jgi:hypothetical protein
VAGYLKDELAAKLHPLFSERGRELERALDDFKEKREALSERQAGEWQKTREAWAHVKTDRPYSKDLANDRTSRRDEGQQPVSQDQPKTALNRQDQGGQEKAHEAKRSAFDWLDKTPEAKTPEAKRSAFEWLDKAPEAKAQEAQATSQEQAPQQERDR